MSPVDGYLFVACRSMQNVQYLTLCGGVNKYVVKYIGKIDEQNYVIICTDSSKNGKLVSKAFFCIILKLHRRKNKIEIKINEMIHVMLRYPELYTDLNFIAVPTMPLELQAGVDKGVNSTVDDGADAGIIPDLIPHEQLDDVW